MKILAILTVRNEAAFLLDWLAHHRAVGVTDFLVFSNDCQDGTDLMLDRLQELSWLTHIRNDGPHDKAGIQFAAMKLADKSELVAETDWILALDVDEFVNVHVGDKTVPALLDALPDATAITLTWRLFGNGGIVRFADEPVTRQFTRAAPEVIHWPWRAAMFKTLFRNDKTYRNIGVHRPRNPKEDRLQQARWFDGHGRELPEEYKTTRIFSRFGQPNFGLAQLNHYPLQSMESYLLKAARGRAVHSADTLDIDYWVERNFNTDTDDSIRALDDRVDPIRAQLGADTRLAALHAGAVAWRRAQFEKLMLEEPFRALLGRLFQTPPTRPVPEKAAHFLISYANKARILAASDPN